jgi:hypothetical protein
VDVAASHKLLLAATGQLAQPTHLVADSALLNGHFWQQLQHHQLVIKHHRTMQRRLARLHQSWWEEWGDGVR